MGGAVGSGSPLKIAMAMAAIEVRNQRMCALSAHFAVRSWADWHVQK